FPDLNVYDIALAVLEPDTISQSLFKPLTTLVIPSVLAAGYPHTRLTAPETPSIVIEDEDTDSFPDIAERPYKFLRHLALHLLILAEKHRVRRPEDSENEALQ